MNEYVYMFLVLSITFALFGLCVFVLWITIDKWTTKPVWLRILMAGIGVSSVAAFITMLIYFTDTISEG